MKCPHDFRRNTVTGYWQCILCEEPGNPIYRSAIERLQERGNRREGLIRTRQTKGR